ncbi:hypothetical protein [Rhizohabitans arisaemae]|uniref:hypothetical protein n=1 Tax=Rhizohabitans arisaemae TaxID=2720610 RepID=UPI0024B106B7|nr:hypothetical protein [Rhizohabitans arisaemae]
MPTSVLIASTLWFLLAATFLIIPVIAYRYGDAAQRAAEAELARQRFPAEILAKHGVKFRESALETLFPFGIAVCVTVLASLNLAGNEVGRIGSWILGPILLIGGGFITAGQVFAARAVESAFGKSGDPTLRDVDVRAMVGAAAAEFPAVLRPLIIARFLLTTLGSLLVVVLLVTPAASAYFG